MEFQAPNTNKNEKSPTKDKIFDPSIDMLINDFDDERTLEEEEALAEGEAQDPSDELSSLEKEGNMPLEELLALYGYRGDNKEVSQEEEEDEENLNEEEVMDIAESEPLIPQEPSKLSAIYEPMAETENDDMRVTESVSRISEDEEEDLANYSSDEEMKKLKKTIMVGSDYQAQVPQGLTTYGDTLPYQNDDQLLWNPNNTPNAAIEEYLRQAQIITNTANHEKDKKKLPNGAHLRDNEQALLIWQQCGYNAEEALRKLQADVQQIETLEQRKDPGEWSDAELKNFEEGIKAHGKNFLLIQKEFVKTRHVSELVAFYYMWKKTERHDMFATKIKSDKKKYTLNPGLTDFMDRFLEEQKKTPLPSQNSISVTNEKPEKAIANT